jgi:endonuclease/exonuclease/phosphatase family metal-dependent hydrolase
MRRSWISRVLTFTAATVAVAGLMPAAAAAHPPVTPSAVVLNVQTYNLDLGADLTPLFGATSLPGMAAAAAGIYADVEASKPAERMQAIADIIAAQPPEVVGLQEVATWQVAPYSVVGGYPVATGPYMTTYDFLGMLLDDLAAAGTPYTAEAEDVTFDSAASVPIAVPISATLAGRYIDRNVILVSNTLERRATISNGQGHNYAAALPVTILGQTIAVHRGWASIDINTRGRMIRFFDTHLEAYGYPPYKDQIRNPQSVELGANASAAVAAGYQAIVVGDMNARPTMCTNWRQPPDPQDLNVVAYGNLQAAGLREVWPLVHSDAPCGPAGWTSGEDSLDGPNTLSHRIDDVFLSNGFSALEAAVVGNTDADRTVSGLWPSDHASTVAKIRLDVAH